LDKTETERLRGRKRWKFDMKSNPDNATELTAISLEIDDESSGVPSVKIVSKLRRVPDWALNNLPDTTYEKVKFWTLVLSGVVVVRTILFIVFLLCGGLCGVVAAIGVDPDPQKPWPKWRTWVAAPIMFFSRCLLFCAGFHWIEIDDRQKTKGQMVVIGEAHFPPSPYTISPYPFRARSSQLPTPD
jgi:hypothetical protein